MLSEMSDIGGFAGTLTLTTAQSDTLAVEVDSAASIGSVGYRVQGPVLGSMSTGQFAQDSGAVSGTELYLSATNRLKLSFTIKLRQPAATLSSTGDVPDSRVVASPRAV
jgi:hypothetical protein